MKRDADKIEIDIKDESNPDSLINKLPSMIANILRVIPDEVLCLGDEGLERTGKISEVDKRLRHSFWLEYNYAIKAQRVINITNVYSGICHRDNWQRIIVTNTFKMAYILTPPPDHRVDIQQILHLATKEMRKIIQTPHEYKNKKGEKIIDSRLVASKLKIWELVTNRIHGGVTQKLEVDTKNLNMNVDARDVSSVEAINKQIAELESQLAQKRTMINVSKKEPITLISSEEQTALSEVRIKDVDGN